VSSLTENALDKPKTGASEALKAAFQQRLQAQKDIPAWLRDAKNEAFADFEALPMPGRKDEAWRFANVKDLALDPFRFEPAPDPDDPQALVAQSDFIPEVAGRFVFAGDQTVHSQPLPEELRAKGVVWTTFQDAFRETPDLLKDYLLKQATPLGSEKFARLHAAFLENGALLYVPKGVEIDKPFALASFAAGDGAAVFPHTLVIAEEFSKVSLVEAHLSADPEAPGLFCGVCHLFAGVGSQIDYALLQNANERSLGFQINSNVAGKDSQVRTAAVNLGGRHYRTETHGQIRGPGANVEMRSLAIARSQQEIDQRTLQTHAAPHARSDLLFKNVLLDEARTIFSGLIRVEEQAQHTDAYQTNRNLQLSDQSEANSLPGLEIEANDVKCSHGATTAKIDEEEIFYMLARGISKERAAELVVRGFAEEIVGQIKEKPFAERISALIEAKLTSQPAKRQLAAQ